MEEKKVPVFDLSEMDKIENKKIVVEEEKFEEPINNNVELLKEKQEDYHLNEDDLHEIINKLKIIDYNDIGFIDRYLEKIKNNKSAVNDVIEARAKDTLINMLTYDEVDEDRLITDIAILKNLQADKFDFSDVHIHLNYDPSKKEESVDLSQLVDIYKDMIIDKKGTNYRIYIDEKEIDPIYELNSIKFQNDLRNEINNMLDNSNTVDNNGEKIERL